MNVLITDFQMWRIDNLLLPLLIVLGCWLPLPQLSANAIPFQTDDSAWVDRLLKRMSTSEKLGQLLILRSDLAQAGMTDSLLHWVHQQKMGGMILEDLPIDTFLNYVGISEQMTGIPLLNGTTQRVSLHNQFSDIKDLPSTATIGAVTSDSLLAILQTKYLEQLAALHINFAYLPPIKDDFQAEAFVHTSSETSCAHRDWLTALTEQRILTIGEQYALQNEFEQDWAAHFTQGLSGISIAEEEYLPNEFECQPSGFFRADLVQKKLHNGLIISELTKNNDIGKLLQTGADLLVVRDSIDKAYAQLKFYYRTGILSKEELNAKVRKILLAKNWADRVNTPDNLPPLIASAKGNPFAQHTSWNAAETVKKIAADECEATHPIKTYFEHPAWATFARQLYEESIVLAHNPERALPLRELHGRDFQIFQYGSPVTDFVQQFNKYADAQYEFIQAFSECNEFPELSKKYLKASTVVLTINQEYLDTMRCKDWLTSVNALSKKTTVIVVNFGNPRNLGYFNPTVSCIQAMQDHPTLQSLAAQLIFGGTSANGRLTMEVAPHLPFGISNYSSITRLKYTIPAEVGIAPERLVGIDAIAKNAIALGATPGCQVLVAKNGKVIYNKAFGYHTYEKKQGVRTSDLYDLASITKVAATTLATMKLHDLQQIKPADRLNVHVPLSERTTLKYVTLRHLLTHRSGLAPNLPIVPILLQRDTFNRDCEGYFCNESSSEYSIPVADNFYFSQLHADTVWQKVQRMRVSRRKRYRYSDVNFYLLQKVVEKKSSVGLDQYLAANFYNPLHLRYLGYNPRKKHVPQRIVPTTNDFRWRQQLVRGYVHDETAAIQGGVGGNAGLFSTAEDLAVLFQMLLNGGHYGGRQFLTEPTIEYFTSKRHGSHRGLGFDKPYAKKKKPAYARSASPQTFGHTGFTGTAVWTDPTHNLTFIFLANRIHPDRNNKKLYQERVRARMHQVVYDALGTHQGSLPELKMEQRI
ncbi:MAG: serine hydrolase domain-containing protein [Saprospiraceae bacterium]